MTDQSPSPTPSPSEIQARQAIESALAEHLDERDSEVVVTKLLDLVRVEVRQEISGTHYSGPLPPPEVAERYESVCPGTMDRLIRVFEEQASHRQQMERRFAEQQAEDARSLHDEFKRGQNRAFALGFLCLFVGGVVIAIGLAVGREVGAGIAGGLFSLTGIAAIVTTFLQTRDSVETDGDPEN